MHPTCFVSTVQAAGGAIMVWGTFSLLIPFDHCLNAYLSIHVHPFTNIIYSSSNDYHQHDNAPCHKPIIISNWFEHDTGFSVYQSLDLNLTEHLWDVAEQEIRSMNVQLTNLYELRDVVESMPQRMRFS